MTNSSICGIIDKMNLCLHDYAIKDDAQLPLEVCVLVEEVGEIARALIDGDTENFTEEVFDAMVVLFKIGQHATGRNPSRFIERLDNSINKLR